MKIFNITIYILFIISILINLLLYLSAVGISAIYEDELIINDIEWCEYSNDWIDISNDILLELKFSNSDYSEHEYYENIDCWERGYNDTE